MDRQVFSFPQVSPNESMINDPFYHWLNVRYNSCKINAINRENPDWYCYLTDIGFNSDVNIVTEESLNILKNIEDYWFNCTPYFEPKHKEELFYYGFKQGELSNFVSVEFATPELVQMVINAGWIYAVTPETTYFEITNGYLFAKYQSILGSRKICKVKD